MRMSGSRIVGIVEGLLLVRLVGLLFAVRPDNPVYEALLAVTLPLVWPWIWLDRLAHQPMFGARLELATLAAMTTVVVLAGLWSLYSERRSRRLEQQHG